MGQSSVAIYEWLFWTISVASAGVALVRAAVASTGGPRIVRQDSGAIGILWIVCAASALTGFILAAAAVQAGGS